LARCASSGAQKLIARPLFPARGTANTVHVHFRIPRQLKVHHQLKRFDIQTARSDVGRHQHAGAAVGETDQRLIAIALFQIAMQRQCALPGGIQGITNRLTVFLVLQNTTQEAG
jgi:hypothetical protein